MRGVSAPDLVLDFHTATSDTTLPLCALVYQAVCGNDNPLLDTRVLLRPADPCIPLPV
jgi:hypothetical protein